MRDDEEATKVVGENVRRINEPKILLICVRGISDDLSLERRRGYLISYSPSPHSVFERYPIWVVCRHTVPSSALPDTGEMVFGNGVGSKERYLPSFSCNETLDIECRWRARTISKLANGFH